MILFSVEVVLRLPDPLLFKCRIVTINKQWRLLFYAVQQSNHLLEEHCAHVFYNLLFSNHELSLLITEI